MIKKHLIKLFLILIAFAFLLVYIEKYPNKPSNPSKPLTKEEKRKKQIRSQFSAWDGSHVKVEKYIKNEINDPDSYVHVKTVYSDMGDYLFIKTTFRAKNSFGAVVKESVEAYVTIEGKLHKIQSHHNTNLYFPKVRFFSK